MHLSLRLTPPNPRPPTHPPTLLIQPRPKPTCTARAQEIVEGPEAGTLRQAVWIIQSYANRGSLYDAIERGLLRGADGEPDLGTILAAGEVSL